MIRLSCEALLTTIQKSPCLQVLIFKKGVSLPKYRNDLILDPLPMCFRTHLKQIEINCFSGDEEELHAIKVLLQAASVPDTLNIGCSFDCDTPTGSERLKKLYEQIVRFPKGSMNCEIVLD